MRRSYRTPGLGGVVPRALLWAGIRCPDGTLVGGELRKEGTGLRERWWLWSLLWIPQRFPEGRAVSVEVRFPPTREGRGRGSGCCFRLSVAQWSGGLMAMLSGPVIHRGAGIRGEVTYLRREIVLAWGRWM
jgi:hypothetical protein